MWKSKAEKGPAESPAKFPAEHRARYGARRSPGENGAEAVGAARRRRRRRGAAVVLACAALAGVLGGTGTAALAGENVGENVGENAGALRRDAAAVHRAGAVGVTAVLETPNGTVTAHAGSADLDTGAPARADARVRVGSLIKPFVATVALQLVGEERLSLDSTVEEWLPGLVTGNDNDGSRITVRHLLQHTSGIPDFLGRSELVPAFYSAAGYRDHHLRHYADEELVRGALRSPAEFEPGDGWSYSNTNYVLVGLIIERVTGRSWEEEVRERLVEPLGLTGTELPEDGPHLPAPFLRGYHTYPEDGVEGGLRVDTTVLNPTLAGASGALVSTPRDVDRFLTALLGGELLEPAQRAELLRAREIPGRPDTHYGLGIERRRLSCGGYYWGHGGTIMGYHAEGGVTQDGERAVTVAINSFDTVGDDRQDLIDEEMADLVDNALCGGQ
ncbi:serine hydrolase [Streptomyces sp. 3MP-14]|uniref:Serine hydrolase n=1 Tax=Streptomyces mimosae TaxID=2586635 RepID=A0A5N6AJ50_9ACTN|nr:MULTISPECIES: serine hydrolase domain-containing protein [Streptomyces]KAB8168741.1 serine hydrolase [Streptomyces mimosae]KAB8177979.1 serine hydrolase [Streptomyces sp. 3MP-14]